MRPKTQPALLKKAIRSAQQCASGSKTRVTQVPLSRKNSFSTLCKKQAVGAGRTQAPVQADLTFMHGLLWVILIGNPQLECHTISDRLELL